MCRNFFHVTDPKLKIMSQNKTILESCSCSVLSPKVNEIFEKPHLYISFIQNYISNYRFHFKYEHLENYVSHHFSTKFIISIIDILNSFRKQVLFYDKYVLKPFGNIDQLSQAIQICADLIIKLNKKDKIEKNIIIDLLSFLKEIFNEWESYVFQNAILSFV